MPEGDAHHMGGTMRLGARCTAIALAYSDRAQQEQEGKGKVIIDLIFYIDNAHIFCVCMCVCMYACVSKKNLLLWLRQSTGSHR